MDKRKMFINMFASILAFAIQFFISFFISPRIVGQLGEEALGFVNLANNFVQYATLVTVAINSMASRYISVEYNRNNISEAKQYFSSVFWANAILYLLIMIAAVIMIFRLENVLSISPDLVVPVKITFLLSFINLGFSLLGTVYSSSFFATNNMHYSSIVGIVCNIVRTILVYVLFFCIEPQIHYLSLATLIIGILSFICNYFFTKRLFEGFTISKQFFSIDKVIILAKSGMWILLSNISNLLLNGVDLLITNKMLNASLMGRLTLSKQIPTALSQVLGTLSVVFSASLTQVFAKNNMEKVIEDSIMMLRILAVALTVPFAGCIVFGMDFMNLWLRDTVYTNQEIQQIYIMMIIFLLDIVTSTYMYSIHSVFIAFDKVKVYSIMLAIASIISIFTTIVLVKYTGLGLYAIVGTSTVVLGVTHGIIVPYYAAKMLKTKSTTYLFTELKFWIFLGGLTAFYALIKNVMVCNEWITFFVSVAVSGCIGYFISYLFLLTKSEREKVNNKLLKIIKK